MSEQWPDRLQRLAAPGGLEFDPAEYGFGNSEALALKALARFDAERRVADLESGAWCPESPIEEALLVAILVQAREEWDELHLGAVGTAGMVPNVLWVGSQVELGEYRVDITLHGRNRWGFDPHYVDRRLAVECDGHDFHERTKEQAARDKSRDRAIQALGVPVLRFTGSEIWKDPYGCADEALATLMSRLFDAQRERLGEA